MSTLVGMPFCASSSLIVPFWPSPDPDVEDERVVGEPEALDLVDDPAGLDVGVLGIAGVDLHQPALERALLLGDVVPGRHLRVAGSNA